MAFGMASCVLALPAPSRDDRGVAIAGVIWLVHGLADFVDNAGRRKECLQNRPERRPIRALRAHRTQDWPFDPAAVDIVHPAQREPCRRAPFNIYKGFESRISTEIPGELYTDNRLPIILSLTRFRTRSNL
jgi:hypothetical protein